MATVRTIPPGLPPGSALSVTSTTFGAGERQKSVLVVEDEALIALDISQRLRRLGYKVCGEADTFEDALAMFRETTPDLVLLDISIRGSIDGIETARAICRERDVPVVFLTAFADDNTLRRAAEVSPYGYLLKPFDERTLAVTLRVALERHAADTRVRVLSAAMDSATVGISLIDAHDRTHRVVFSNAALIAMAGGPHENALRAPLTFLSDDPQSPVVQRLREAVETKTHAEGTVLGRRSSGAPLWLSVTVSPAPDRSGQVTHMLVFHQDITRERTAESSLAASQRLELAGRLGAGVAHDLNNVFGAIMTFTDLAGNGLDDPMRCALLAEVLAAAERGATATRRFLDFAHHAEDTAEAVSDLSRVIGDARPMLVQMVGPHVRISLRVTPEPMLVPADATAIEQILLNVAALASDNMPEGGSIFISTTCPDEPTQKFEAGQYVKIDFVYSATGGSVERNLRKLALGAYTETDSMYVTSRMLVERAGGALSNHVDAAGMVVSIDLPISSAVIVPDAGVVPGAPNANAAGAWCLLVEDEPASRRAYARALEAVGFQVAQAASAEMAFRELESRGAAIRLVICDVVLPGLSGTAVLERAALQAPSAANLVITGSRNRNGLPPETTVLWKPFGADTLARRALDALPQTEEAGAPLLYVEPLVQKAIGAIRNSVAEAEDQPNVLVVDDDKMALAAISAVLEGRRIHVIRSESGAEALLLAAQNDIQLALVDVNLPDADGVDLLASLRAGDALLPTIIITGDRSLETAQRSIRAKAGAYITKPFDRTQLIEEVERALAEGQLARLQRKFLLSKAGLSSQFVDFATTAVDLDAAIAGLYMAYQPIVRPHDRSVFAYEALMRTHSQALRDPSQLLAAAEALGRISELGRAVRESVATTLLQNPQCTEPIFVNLHPSELQTDLALETEPLFPFASRVVLEVTERDQIGSEESLHETLRVLRAVGYQLALDDLGEGYAGLSWLIKLRPDIAKLDMSLVRDIDGSALKRELVSSLVGVGRRARTVIVAEGVETEAEAQVLSDLGCDLLQGYHFARPGLPFPKVQPLTAAAPKPTATRTIIH